MVVRDVLFVEAGHNSIICSADSAVHSDGMTGKGRRQARQERKAKRHVALDVVVGLLESWVWCLVCLLQKETGGVVVPTVEPSREIHHALLTCCRTFVASVVSRVRRPGSR